MTYEFYPVSHETQVVTRSLIKKAVENYIFDVWNTILNEFEADLHYCIAQSLYIYTGPA